LREKVAQVENRDADAIGMHRPRFLFGRSGALVITAVAATDLIYRLLLRESVRRALGMSD